MADSQKIWFITGVSSGFGRHLFEEVAARGDIAIGTVRQQKQMDDIMQSAPAHTEIVLMDVTKVVDVRRGIEQVKQKYGRIDVLVNNAGYGLFGAVEETSMTEARDQMETNFFGALAVTQEVLPIMRGQRSGHIIQISSIAGLRGVAGLGIYNASKFALEGFSEALAIEVAPLGIHVTLVEPGPYRTNWAGASSRDTAIEIDDYAQTAHKIKNTIHGYSGNQPGDPVKAAQLIFKIVHADKPPLHLVLGKAAIEGAIAKIEQLRGDIEAWKPESLATAFDN